MKFNLFKPNQKSTGCVASFSYNLDRSGEPSLFVNMVQQHSWNATTKSGSFKENAKDPNKSVTVKLSAQEAGEMISSINRRIPFAAFHTTQDSSTTIKFSPWDKKRTIKGPNGDELYDSAAFSFSVSKNSNNRISVPIEAGETEVLVVLLKAFISEYLTYVKEKENADMQQRNNSGGSNGNRRQQSQQSAPQDNSADDDDVPF